MLGNSTEKGNFEVTALQAHYHSQKVRIVNYCTDYAIILTGCTFSSAQTWFLAIIHIFIEIPLFHQDMKSAIIKSHNSNSLHICKIQASLRPVCWCSDEYKNEIVSSSFRIYQRIIKFCTSLCCSTILKRNCTLRSFTNNFRSLN